VSFRKNGTFESLNNNGGEYVQGYNVSEIKNLGKKPKPALVARYFSTILPFQQILSRASLAVLK
jgi:hypothetical protein